MPNPYLSWFDITDTALARTISEGTWHTLLLVSPPMSDLQSSHLRCKCAARRLPRFPPYVHTYVLNIVEIAFHDTPIRMSRDPTFTHERYQRPCEHILRRSHSRKVSPSPANKSTLTVPPHSLAFRGSRTCQLLAVAATFWWPPDRALVHLVRHISKNQNWCVIT